MPDFKPFQLGPHQRSNPFFSPFQPFSTDWHGAAAPVACGFRLSLGNDALRYRFHCDSPPYCDESVEYMEFREGLWEADVAELFVSGPGGSYLELNLSPTGGWWAAEFSQYRCLARERPDLPFELETQRSLTGWQVECRLPLAALEGWGYPSWERVPMKVCAIVYREEPLYLCSEPAQGEPDFHLAQGYQRLDPLD